MEQVQTPEHEMFSQPGYSFLASKYNLMYQCIMPNCRLTIANLRKHCDLSDEVEEHILESSCMRICCQRLLDFMLDLLNTDKDYMKFCYLLFLSTVVTDLPCQLISMFQSNGYWDHTAKVYPELEALYTKYQTDKVQDSKSPDNVTVGNQIACHTAPATEFEAASEFEVAIEFEVAFVGRADNLTSVHGIKNRRHRRQRVCHFHPDTATYDTVMHSQLSSQLETTCNPELEPKNAVDLTPTSHSMLQTTTHMLTTSTTQQLDIIQDSTVSDIPANISETHDRTVFASNLSEMNSQSDINTSSVSNDVHSHEESASVDDVNHDQSPSDPSMLPEKLITNKDLEILKHKYTALLQAFPVTHLSTLECLQDYLTDDCIGAVVESTNVDLANKMMLDCLISKLTCREDLLDFFDQLEEIKNVPNLASTINGLRQELQHTFEGTNLDIDVNQSILTNGTAVTTLELKSWFLTQTTVSDHCKDLFKRHYQALCSSLPRDVEKTKARLLQYSRMLPSSAIEKITPDVSAEIVNQRIVNFLIISCKNDEELLHFCDLFENLVENPLFIHYVEALRNDFLTLDYTQPHEQAIEAATTNLPLNDQTSRNADIQTEQSITEIDSMQDTATPAGELTSKGYLASKVRYEQSRLEQGLGYFKPPVKPPVLVDRKELLGKLATAVVMSSLNPSNFNPTVTVTGAGGFGKTTLITAVCYNRLVTECFTDGFLFIEIGLQPVDPASQLHQLYSRLTGGKSFPRGNLANLTEAIRSFTDKYYRNLLVLIDDVWDIGDAEPILKAFSSCKTILTSRMSDICQFISSEEQIIVDAMTELEAVNLLLTDQPVDANSLSENTMKLVAELAQDVLLWPLLLFLVRGHIKRNQQLYSHSFEKTIQEVQSELYKNGLTAFDKNVFDKSKGRKTAIKACVEVSLDFLQLKEKDKLMTLILYTGIGGSVPISVLYLLWEFSKEEAKTCLEKLWSYGLVMSKQLLIPPQNNIQDCAEVHCTIGTYIINSLSSQQVVRLSLVCDNLRDVTEGLTNAFIESYGCHPSQLDGEKFLEYWKIRLEHDVLTFYLRRINMCAVCDPHKIILLMEQTLDALQHIPEMFQILAELASEFAAIGEESKMLFKKTTKSSQKLSQEVRKHMYENDYRSAVSTLQNYCSNYEIGKVASKSAELCSRVISRFGGQVHPYFVQQYQRLLMLTPDYHEVTGTTIVLARIELHIDLYKQILSALESKSTTQIQAINDYMKSGKFHEEERLVNIHHSIKLKRIAPDFVH